MKRSFIAFLFLATGILATSGQEKKIRLNESKIVGTATKSEIFTTPCAGSVSTQSTDLKWRPILTRKSIAFEPQVPDQEKIEKIKTEKFKMKYLKSDHDSESDDSSKSVIPVIGTNYMANTNNGMSPLDNSLAISNGGWIVSVANTTIEYDDMYGNNSYFNDLISFINDPAITNVCDPVVIYDVSADRFIFFCQTMPINSYSKLIVCFSKSNNPNDGWWRYKLNGNPLNTGEGFDYPKLAVSTNELYITGNMFFESTLTFDQVILFQINKISGYAGSNINWMYWYNIPGSPFTLLPVSHGQGSSYGPGCYLVATDNAGSSNIKFYELTDYMTGSPTLNQYNVSTTAYSPAGDAAQSGTTCLLDNGDCRALSGFYLNGIIHFVFHSDIGSGWNGINYNRLTINGLSNQSSTFGLVGSYDYCYPSVVSYATSTNDKSVMINFGRTGSAIYPEVRVVNCDDGLNWSGSVLVKSSSSYVSYTSYTKERWGDYTGATRKHNSVKPSVWISGSYGTSSNRWNAWNAEVHDNSSGIAENKGNSDLRVFPNPVTETFSIEFKVEKNTDIGIDINDLSGRLVKELFRGKALSGDNTFSFNKANLRNGTYFIVIKDGTNTIKNEKIIIAD